MRTRRASWPGPQRQHNLRLLDLTRPPAPAHHRIDPEALQGLLSMLDTLDIHQSDHTDCERCEALREQLVTWIKAHT